MSGKCKCGGKGYIMDPPGTGVTICGECTLRLVRERLAISSQLPVESFQKGWSDYRALPGRVDAIKKAQEWVPNHVGLFVLRGGNGVGKTTLMTIMAAAILEQGCTDIEFVSVPMLFHRYKVSGFDNEVLYRPTTARVLFLDEIDKAGTLFEQRSLVYLLLAGRINNLGNMGTVMAMNRTIPEVAELYGEDMGGFLQSRLEDGRTVHAEITNGDVRPRMQWPQT